MPASGGSGTRSLHGMAPGERARVVTILFDRLRAECTQLGLEPGEQVLCRAASPGWLILETKEGRCVRLERGWARFVEIADVGTDAEPSARSGGRQTPARSAPAPTLAAGRPGTRSGARRAAG